MSSKLRDLIVGIRGCNTSAEERAYVQKECAGIRAAFKDGSYPARNMLKLMYIAMLGYPTEFAQMEVVNLIAQPEYGDKRIGYLTLSVLLDETHEVLTLAENRLKKDLADTNPFIQSLALTTVASVAGEDMSRDVMHEVSTLVDNSNTQLKKKACLASLRIVRKVPDFAEIFLEKLGANAFNERQHGALLCSLTLLTACLETKQGASFMPMYRQQIPAAVRLLKGLVLSSSAMEHDVCGVADPFLQVALLRFLRIVGIGSPAASEAMNDMLAQVGTNTDSGKNAGCAILYEAARTIFAICSDEGLRVLGINILARFLTNNRDNNLRFVALAALLAVNKTMPDAVQTHRSTIIDCLKDVDTSIRRRALDLTIALVNATNVRILVPDLITYLNACGDELKKETTVKVCQVIEEQSPTSDWRIETSLRVFKVAKVHIPVTFAAHFIAHVSQQATTTQSFVVASLWEELSLPFDAQMQLRHALLVAGLWCVGEYCDLLVAQNGGAPQFLENVASCVFVITGGTQLRAVQQYGLTALAKILCKFPSVAALVSSIFDMYAGSLDCELQQRACEYATLTETFPDLAAFALAKMPPMVVAKLPQENSVSSPAALLESPTVAGAAGTGAAAPPAQRTGTKAPVNIFDDIFAPMPASAAPAAAAPSSSFSVHSLFDSPAKTSVPVSTSAAAAHVLDIFGSSSLPAATSQPLTQPQQQPMAFIPPVGLSVAPPVPPAAVPPQPMAASLQFTPMLTAPTAGASISLEAFRCEDFVVSFTVIPDKPGDYSICHVEARVKSELSRAITGFSFLAAVPKTTVLEMKPLLSTEVGAFGTLVQQLTVDNRHAGSPKVALMLRVRIVYSVDGVERLAQFQISKDLP